MSRWIVTFDFEDKERLYSIASSDYRSKYTAKDSDEPWTWRDAKDGSSRERIAYEEMQCIADACHHPGERAIANDDVRMPTYWFTHICRQCRVILMLSGPGWDYEKIYVPSYPSVQALRNAKRQGPESVDEKTIFANPEHYPRHGAGHTQD